MSCNGCRALRKGCGHDCVLRPSIQWIKSSQSQANATHFLAKFYGRAGLENLLNSGPAHLRPLIFKSLLYEACGRIINPTGGSVGLMSSGKWPECHSAVEAVLQGAPVTIPTNGSQSGPSYAADGHYSIRRLSKPSSDQNQSKSRHRSKRPARKLHVDSVYEELAEDLSEAKFTITGWDHNSFDEHEATRGSSGDSSTVETAEPDFGIEPIPCAGPDFSYWAQDDVGGGIGLELTLGFSTMWPAHEPQ